MSSNNCLSSSKHGKVYFDIKRIPLMPSSVVRACASSVTCGISLTMLTFNVFEVTCLSRRHDEARTSINCTKCFNKNPN